MGVYVGVRDRGIRINYSFRLFVCERERLTVRHRHVREDLY